MIEGYLWSSKLLFSDRVLRSNLQIGKGLLRARAESMIERGVDIVDFSGYVIDYPYGTVFTPPDYVIEVVGEALRSRWPRPELRGLSTLRRVIAELERAEKEVDVILFDGGNNDWNFYDADLLITIADPHRLGHERSYFPGEVNVRRSDVIIINKAATAPSENISKLKKSVKELNSGAKIIVANSPITIKDASLITNMRVLVVDVEFFDYIINQIPSLF